MSAYRWLAFIILLCTVSGCGKHTQTAYTSSPTPTTLHNGVWEDNPKLYATFKQRMLPKVGQTITTTGLVQFGKMGLHMPLEECDVWIYDTKESDLATMNQLIERFDRHVVTVTGPLRHQDSTAPSDLPPDAEVAIQYLPDHFYFDVEEIKMSEASNKH